MAKSRLEAEKDGVRIPVTVDDYIKLPPKPIEGSTDLSDSYSGSADDCDDDNDN